MVSMIFRKVIDIALFVIVLAPVAAQGQGLKVALLGTGSPGPAMNRFGPSTLVEAGEQNSGTSGRGFFKGEAEVGGVFAHNSPVCHRVRSDSASAKDLLRTLGARGRFDDYRNWGEDQRSQAGQLFALI